MMSLRPGLNSREDVSRWLRAMSEVFGRAERVGHPIAPGVEGGVYVHISDELAREIAADLKTLADLLASGEYEDMPERAA